MLLTNGIADITLPVMFVLALRFDNDLTRTALLTHHLAKWKKYSLLIFLVFGKFLSRGVLKYIFIIFTNKVFDETINRDQLSIVENISGFSDGSADDISRL